MLVAIPLLLAVLAAVGYYVTARELQSRLFTSGWIILFERPVRVGDLVSIGPTLGTVSRIRIRAITITDFDNFEVMVPNKAFITETVQNWSLTNEVTRGNPDDSGRVAYAATTPVAGLMFRANANWHFYASYGQGFETPTFNELSYRADGSGGLAFNLQPARSRSAEIGANLRWSEHGKLDTALFRAKTRNELGVDTSEGGRTTYRNIGRARRQGAELQASVPITKHWTLHTAYTYLDARVNISAGPCPAGTSCRATGNRLPGVPRHALDLSLNWAAHDHWHAGLDVRVLSVVPVNDANTASAPGYALLARTIHELRTPSLDP